MLTKKNNERWNKEIKELELKIAPHLYSISFEHITPAFELFTKAGWSKHSYKYYQTSHNRKKRFLYWASQKSIHVLWAIKVTIASILKIWHWFDNKNLKFGQDINKNHFESLSIRPLVLKQSAWL